MAAIALRQYTTMASGGTSETARFVASKLEQPFQRLQDSHVLGQSIKGSLNELDRVFAECCQANWDGYGAAPISMRTARFAHEFLGALPLGAPAPSVGAEPDGHVTLEWHHSLRRTLSISVSPEGDLHYAALVGASKVCGTEPFFDEVPREIVSLIRRVASV